jgi:hypothetical protein
MKLKQTDTRITNKLHTIWWDSSLLNDMCRDEFDILVMPLYRNGMIIQSYLYLEIKGSH